MGGPARWQSPGSCQGRTGTRRWTSGWAGGSTGAPSPMPSRRNLAADSKAKKLNKTDEIWTLNITLTEETTWLHEWRSVDPQLQRGSAWHFHPPEKESRLCRSGDVGTLLQDQKPGKKIHPLITFILKSFGLIPCFLVCLFFLFLSFHFFVGRGGFGCWPLTFCEQCLRAAFGSISQFCALASSLMNSRSCHHRKTRR